MPGPYELAVFIGRFQPFHNGHLRVVREALAQAGRLLIVLGSEGAARRPDLIPFTAQDRREMILASLLPAERARVTLRGVGDVGNLVLWAEAVQRLADETLAEAGLAPDARVTLIGHSKDRSSYYLRAFPRWGVVDVPHYDQLSATPIRLAYFDEEPSAVQAFLEGPARTALPPGVVEWLERFREHAAYGEMVAEWAWVKAYRRSWEAAPFPPVFVTADAVVIQGAHVLLIRRKGRPGLGLWALPGGFLEQDEFIADAAVRELREETGIETPDAELRRSMVATRVFDAPFRDMRGRTVTHATLFHLQPTDPELPKVQGADDAEHARWIPLEQLRREEMFGDHYAIIQTLKGLLTNRG